MLSTYEALGWISVLHPKAREARYLSALNPFPEQEPVLGGKAQAGPASCPDGPDEAVRASPWNGRSKCQVGRVRLSGRGRNVLTEPASCREHPLHGCTLPKFHATSPSSLGGGLQAGQETQKKGSG